MSAPQILASSVLCAVGRGPAQVWASCRSGLGGIVSSPVMDRSREPIRMGLVPEEALEPLPPELDNLPLPARARRMLRLGAPMLGGVAPAAGNSPLRLYLGLPQLDPVESPWIRSFAVQLARLAGVPLDVANSRVIPGGRAAALVALELALATLVADPSMPIVVGAVDSFLDLKLLAELDAEQRLLGPRVMDGFIPGEGAAFYVLSAMPDPPADPQRRRVRVLGAASIKDPGHRYGTEPARGEGLAQAIAQMRTRLTPAPPPVATTFAGFNGENFDAKLWGVTQIRHSEFLAPGMLMEHPADRFGDTGAAAGAILTVIAATALAAAQRPGPALVWAASDRETRGCALLATAV